MDQPPSDQPQASPADDNIKAVFDLERQTDENASRGERIGRSVSKFAGSMTFVAVHAAAIVAWVAWNTGAAEGLRFDPYPFGLLSLIGSFEGVLIATFVLIAQNRMNRTYEQRDHLHLQINLLAEQEMTVVLKLLRRIADRLDIAPETGEDAQAEKLAEQTDLHDLVDRLRRELGEKAPT